MLFSFIGGQKTHARTSHGEISNLKRKIFHRTFEFKSCKLAYERIMRTYNSKTDLTDNRVTNFLALDCNACVIPISFTGFIPKM